jgi:hypothetical protein
MQRKEVPMSKRFTDTEKWKDDWFLSLSNDEKVAWFWLLDNCNHAGICKPSIGLLNFMCRTNYTEDQLIQIMDGRVVKFEGMWFIPKFLKFQYGTLVSNMPAVKSVVKELKAKKLLDFSKAFVEVPLLDESHESDNSLTTVTEQLPKSSLTLKDKDKDKDKDKNKVKVLLDINPFSENFRQIWDEWKKYKIEQHGFKYKSVLTEKKEFNRLLKLSEKNESFAVELIDNAIARAWEGIHIPNDKKQKQHEPANRDQARIEYWNHMVDTFGTDEEKATRKIV